MRRWWAPKSRRVSLAALLHSREQGREMKMAKSDRKAVDEYIASQPKAVQSCLTRVRRYDPEGSAWRGGDDLVTGSRRSSSTAVR